jgi:hypothetical protein
VEMVRGIPRKGDAPFRLLEMKKQSNAHLHAEVTPQFRTTLILASGTISNFKKGATSGAALALLGKAYLYD